MNKKISLFTLMAVLSSPMQNAIAEEGNDEQRKLFLTIYNDDLALIEDQRSIDLQKGFNHIEFKDVSTKIRPETVSLHAKGISILEQNFDFDLLTPAKLIEKSVNQQIKIVRINPGNGEHVTETARVLSVNQGVVLDVNGQIEVLRADNVPTRVIFDKIPENLRAQPTLSINIESDAAGRQPLTLRYLSTGLSWKADYVALFDEKLGVLDLQGWITLTNNSGINFNNANAQLVAGSVRLSNNRHDYDNYQRSRYQGRTAYTSEKTNRTAFADYYIYPLLNTTTIANNQTKQISFVDAKNVKAKKIYQYYSAQSRTGDLEHADVALRFSNAEAAGLGQPLASGMMRVYMRDSHEKPTFIGESAIDHSPQGSELTVRTGEAFDVTIQPRLIEEKSLGSRHYQRTMEYLIRNARNNSIEIEISHRENQSINKTEKEKVKGKWVDAHTISWAVPVKANGEFALQFTVDTREK